MKFTRLALPTLSRASGALQSTSQGVALRALTLVAALLASAPPALASPIVDTAFVAAARERGVIIWDVRDAANYARGHVPGAVNIGDALQVLRNPVTEDFVTVARIEKMLGDGGIDPAREIVVYSTRGHTGGYFALFTLQYFGAKSATVYHDGIDGWRDAGRPMETAPARLAPVALKLTPNAAVAATTQDVIARLRDPGVQILDVRTPGEFDGTDVRAIRGGHIPGATNIPFEQNWVDPQTAQKLARREVTGNAGMSLKPDSALRDLYSKLDPAKETIVYCQSGVRAAETASVLAKLGFRNVKVYDSSWLGYAAKLDAPVASEVFFNVGAMNARMAAMLGRIEALERELAEAKKAAGQ